MVVYVLVYGFMRLLLDSMKHPGGPLSALSLLKQVNIASILLVLSFILLVVRIESVIEILIEQVVAILLVLVFLPRFVYIVQDGGSHIDLVNVLLLVRSRIRLLSI